MTYAGSSLRRLALAAVVSGAAITATTGVASAASTCTFSPDALPARVDVLDGSGSARLAIERSGQFIAIADVGGPLKLCQAPNGSAATVFNTDRIVVNGTATAKSDEFSVQTLTPGKTLESDGYSEIETNIANAAPTGLAVFGTSGADTMRVGAGGGVMLGPDLDTDVRAFSATEVILQGGPGSDFLSGRGAYPASVPGPATTRVTMFGEEGDDTLVDGPLSQDSLIGDIGNDTLFSADSNELDVLFGGADFDTATVDHGDVVNTVEKLTQVVGRLKLERAAITSRAGQPVRVTLGWKHPDGWKQLRSLKLTASDAGHVVARSGSSPPASASTATGHLTRLTARPSRITASGSPPTCDCARPSSSPAGRSAWRCRRRTSTARGSSSRSPAASPSNTNAASTTWR